MSDASERTEPGGPVAGIPDPIERRVSPDIAGVEAVMGDGRTWILARTGLSRALAPARDRIFERVMLDGVATLADLTRVCVHALRLNYTLSDEELRALVASTPPESIVDALIEAALPSAFDGERSFSHWARSALLINGIAPGSVPPDDLPHVLHHLVAAGRALPVEKFTDVGCHVAMRDTFRGMIAQQELERKAMRATE